ncbi:MAG: NB-ARC domain-containing protein [Crinalium sp.]
MNVDQALQLIDKLILAKNEQHLSDQQIIIFKGAWEGKTYQKIALEHGYSEGHFKNFGEDLWKKLSTVLGETVKKKNFKAALQRRQSQHLLDCQPKDEQDSREASTNTLIDWVSVPDVPVFYGRAEELTTLEEWIVEDRCRLVAILGMGGIGKTSLSIKLTEKIQDEFDYVIWRSLRNEPPITNLLGDIIKILSNQQETSIADTLNEQVSQLIHYLKKHRCLLVLDNAESIMGKGDRVGSYRDGYDGYGELIKQAGEMQHQSCLVLTSREKPKEIQLLEGKKRPVRLFQLQGLNITDAQKIFAEFGDFHGNEDEWRKVIENYRGNPLALKIASATIKHLLKGNLGEFVQNYVERNASLLSDIRDLLERQFNRLSEDEKEIMYWLAIHRKPISDYEIANYIVSSKSRSIILDCLTKSVFFRSLIERNLDGFSQQPVVMEYVIEKLIQEISNEIRSENLKIFNKVALILATSKDYIRNIQYRLILKPVIENITEEHKSNLEAKLKQILSDLRKTPFIPGYASGNILNILVALGEIIEKNSEFKNFSNLFVWQAYLQEVNLYNIDFSRSDLSNSVFSETIGSIFSLAFSQDGELLAAGDANGHIHVWRVKDNQKEHTFGGDISWVWALAFSPDGKTLAAGSDDHTVGLWDVKTGECKVLGKHTKSVRCVAFSPNETVLASSSDDRTVRLWNIKTGEYKLLTEQANSVWSVAFSFDGKFLAIGSDDCTVSIWTKGSSADEWQEVHRLQEHTKPVRSIAFSPNNYLLATAGQDSTVRIWDSATGRCEKILEGHKDWVWSVRFSSQGTTIASASEDQTIRFWDVETGKCIDILQEHNHSVRAIAFSPDKKTLASGSYDQTVKLWELTEKGKAQCLKTWQGLAAQVRSVAFSPAPDGKTLVSCSGDRSIRVWNIDRATSQYEEGKKLEGHTDWVWSAAFSPDGEILASASDDTTVRLWNINTGGSQQLKISCRVRSVTFSPNSNIIACGCNDNTVKLLRKNIDGTWKLQSWVGHSNWVWSVAFSPDGAILATGSEDKTIKLWDVRTGQFIGTLEGHTGMVYSVFFSANGQILASGSADNTVKLWDVKTHQCLKTLREHTRWVWSVAFSPDGQTLASSSGDNTVKLWDISHINNPDCRKTLEGLHGHTNWVRCIAFSSDSKTLASGSDDETVKLWDVQTGKCLITLKAKGPYAGMKIADVKGLTQAEIETLKALGAVEL